MFIAMQISRCWNENNDSRLTLRASLVISINHLGSLAVARGAMLVSIDGAVGRQARGSLARVTSM